MARTGLFRVNYSSNTMGFNLSSQPIRSTQGVFPKYTWHLLSRHSNSVALGWGLNRFILSNLPRRLSEPHRLELLLWGLSRATTLHGFLSPFVHVLECFAILQFPRKMGVISWVPTGCPWQFTSPKTNLGFFLCKMRVCFSDKKTLRFLSVHGISSNLFLISTGYQ